jgi:6-phosphogluconolactonase
MTDLELHVYRDGEELGRGAADHIASALAWAIERNGTASLAVSGGNSPALMFAALARHPIIWSHVHVFQVDERMAPDGDPARNLEMLRTALLDAIDIPPDHVHPIPVRDDLDAAAREYEQTLDSVLGDRPLDVVHLGLGDNGHTASLLPNDPALGVDDRLVSHTTTPFQGNQRVTLTYPALNAAGHILWLIEGASKADMVRRLVAGDDAIPAGRVLQDRAAVFCDEPAVSSLLQGE